MNKIILALLLFYTGEAIAKTYVYDWESGKCQRCECDTNRKNCKNCEDCKS